MDAYVLEKQKYTLYYLISNIDIIFTGSLTNLALALKLDPTFARAPKELVIMGGNYLGVFSFCLHLFSININV